MRSFLSPPRRTRASRMKERYQSKFKGGPLKHGNRDAHKFRRNRELLARELTRFYLEVSSARPSDEAAIRALVDRSLEHARYNAKSAQGFAVAAAPSRVADLHRISAPTLILHGHRDAFFPYSHAVLLAERIPHARLIGIPGAGHALPLQRFYPYLADIVDHIDRAQRIRGSAAAQRAEVLVEANP